MSTLSRPTTMARAFWNSVRSASSWRPESAGQIRLSAPMSRDSSAARYRASTACTAVTGFSSGRGAGGSVRGAGDATGAVRRRVDDRRRPLPVARPAPASAPAARRAGVGGGAGGAASFVSGSGTGGGATGGDDTGWRRFRRATPDPSALPPSLSCWYPRATERRRGPARRCRRLGCRGRRDRLWCGRRRRHIRARPASAGWRQPTGSSPARAGS